MKEGRRWEEARVMADGRLLKFENVFKNRTKLAPSDVIKDQ